MFKTKNSWFDLQKQNITIFQDLMEVKASVHKYIRQAQKLQIPSPLSSESTVLMTQIIEFSLVV